MAPTIGGVSKNGMKRADANKPVIYDSMRGEKYVQQRFLGKVRALRTRARNDARCHILGPMRSTCPLGSARPAAHPPRAGAQGGFGTCYEVKEVSTGDVLATKLVKKSVIDSSKSKRRHLQDEISIHTSLSHPHVVQCMRVFEDMAYLYILMEYVEGVSLQRWGL